MNILVLNQHTNNFGDDAAGVALIHQIFDAFPEAKIDIVYSWNDSKNCIPINDERVNHHLNISLKRTVKDLFKSFLQIIGSNLSSRFYMKGATGDIAKLARNSKIIFVSPCGANIGIYKDWLFLARIMIVIAAGKTPIFHLNTVGKSNSIIFNMLSRFALNKSKIYVRERASLDYCQHLNIHAERGVDTAFSFPDHSTDIELPSSYVILIPTELSNWHVHYRQSSIDTEIMAKTCKDIAAFCKSKAFKIVLLPHLNGSYSEGILLENYKKQLIANGVDEVNIIVANEVINVFRYEHYIRSSEFVVSMRYHGVIFAVKNCIPFISLSYENKMKEACCYSGMSRCHLNIKEVNNVNLIDILHGIYDDRDKIIAELTRRKPYLHYLSKFPVHAAWLNHNS